MYVYAPTAASAESSGDTGLTHGPSQQGISHVSFCYDTSQPDANTHTDPATHADPAAHTDPAAHADPAAYADRPV